MITVLRVQRTAPDASISVTGYVLACILLDETLLDDSVAV